MPTQQPTGTVSANSSTDEVVASRTPDAAAELCVVYEEKEAAKEHGARWDAERGSWVVRSRAPLSSWLMQRIKVQGGASAAAL